MLLWVGGDDEGWMMMRVMIDGHYARDHRAGCEGFKYGAVKLGFGDLTNLSGRDLFELIQG